MPIPDRIRVDELREGTVDRTIPIKKKVSARGELAAGRK